MSVNAKPYQEGKGWAIRARYKGNDIYVSGRKTPAAAVKEAGKEIAHIDKVGQPAWGGPKDKTVAQALQRYALNTLPFKKGGDQEARRINRFLRHAGIDEIVLTRLAKPEQLPAAAADGGLPGKKPKPGVPQKPLLVYFKVATMPAQDEAGRVVPNSLKSHRQMLCVKTAGSDRLRKQIACCKFTKLSTDLLQAYVDALVAEGAAGATVYQELAVLRQLGNHARKRWKWREPEVNPAWGLELPAFKNERDRVMSIDEQQRLLETLANRRAKGVVELVALATETAMRAEEIIGLTWSEVHTDQRLIKLDESKTGARDVPLSPVAIELLDKLGQGPRTGPVFTGMTYSKLAAAWRRACSEAEVTDLRFHDVRATAATRFAEGPGGRNIFLVQALTGHKTLVMVARYVRIKAADVAKLMQALHAGAVAAAEPAGAQRAAGVPSEQAVAQPALASSAAQASEPTPVAAPSVEVSPPKETGSLVPADEATGPNVVRIDFQLRRRA